MKELNKHEFDEIFRTGLSAPDLNEVDEDWELMKARLQTGGKRTRLPYYLLFVSSVAAVLLLVFFVFYNTNETAQVQLADNTSGNQNAAPAAKVSANDKLMSRSVPESSRYEDYEENAQSSESIYLNRAETFIEQNEPLLNVASGDLVNNTVSLPSDSTLESEGTTQPLMAESVNAENLIASSNNTHAESPARVEVVSRAEDLIEDKGKLNPSKGRLSLAINFAPDFNGVEQLQSNKVSYSIGAGLIYNISNKLSIEAGAAYGRKSYQTGFSSFKPVSYNLFQVKPNAVSSGFDVMDIQLNLAYTLLKKGRSSIGIGAGISSYLMLDEQYSFSYPNINARGLSSFHTGYQNNHFLGIANLNFSYKRSLTNNVKLAFNPYLKLPLTDLGYGNIRLRSAGMSVGIITDLNKRKK
jgi:hypothetical protein